VSYKIIKGGTSGGGSTFNFRKDVEAGISAVSILTAKASQGAGVGASQSPATLTKTQTVGSAVSTFATGTVQDPQAAGILAGSVLTQLSKPPSNPGAAITRVEYQYTGEKWVATASDIGTDAWTNLANAQGAADGSSATRAGQTLNATSAEMRCQFDTVSGKGQLTLDKVELSFYVAQSGTILNNGGLSLDYRIGSAGGWTNLVTYVNNQDFLTTPVVFNLTAAAITWANAGDVEVRVGADLVIATGGVTCSVDAVSLDIEASLIDTL
jgi:hypothetical protein